MRSIEPWCRAVLGTLGLIGLFSVVLAMLYRYDWRLDLTSEQHYSLSPHARQLLENLEVDVEMIAFLRGQNPRNPYIRDLLRRAGNASARVRWAEVDVNRSPAKARQYGVTSYGAVVVKSGGRERVVVNPREDSLVWAILQVIREETKAVYFVIGHGERTPANRDRLQGYSLAGARVQQELYEIRTLALPRVDAIPQDATVLLLGGPRRGFSPAEAAVLDGFLERGGRLLVLLNAFEAGDVAPYLERYGVVLPDEAVVDPENRMFGGEFLTMRVSEGPGAHPVTDGLGAPPLFSLARPVLPGPGPAKAQIRPLLWTGPGSWATPDRQVLVAGTPRYVAGRDRPGPISVGIEVRLAARTGAAGQGGRIIVYGNAEFASNLFLDRDGNSDLLLNTINWLADEPALIAPRRPQRARGREQLLVVGEQGATIFWIAVVIQPGLFLLGGLLQLWRRRYTG